MDNTEDVLTAIYDRRSVRTFTGSALDTRQRNAVQKFIDEACVARPFGPAHYVINVVDVDTGGVFRPDTYGFIKGAQTYLAMTVGSSRKDALTAGYAMEQVVIRSWMAGLGTCWIGGTFKASAFLSATTVPDGQMLRIVVPVGVPADRTRFMDRMARLFAGSGRRKDFGKMFFYGNWQSPLDENSTFGRALAAMRCAPSSTNSQPWRAIVIGNTVHFYGVRSNFSDIDMGIGLCHFAIYEYAVERFGAFYIDDNHPDAPALRKVDYVCSYKPCPRP